MYWGGNCLKHCKELGTATKSNHKVPTPHHNIYRRYLASNAEMCPGLGEWSLHKGILNLRNLVIFNVYAQIVTRIPCRHFILCENCLARLHIFNHADILILVNEFVVVVILSEWWSVPTTVGSGVAKVGHTGAHALPTLSCAPPNFF